MKKYRKLIVDAAMSVLLLLLMAYELIGAAVHEWLGIAMFVLVILHHVLRLVFVAITPCPLFELTRRSSAEFQKLVPEFFYYVEYTSNAIVLLGYCFTKGRAVDMDMKPTCGC